MKFRNESIFHLKTLNQEKLLNSLCKKFSLTKIDRLNEKEVKFSCDYSKYKKIEKYLKERNTEIISISHFGVMWRLSQILTSFGLIFAILFISIGFSIQYQYIWKYEILGTEKLDKNSVVSFIAENFDKKKSKIDTVEVETALANKFNEISFASCIIKGQTLVVNIKEKLLPDEKYGQFQPIISQKNAKITKIELISGTLNVKVGDFVEVGDVLVEPYVIDSSGEIKKVEANAKIYAEVYNEGSADHYESFIDVYRTGRVCEESVVTLFGLPIYTFKTENTFKMYEVEYETTNLIQNNFLPFKLKKTKIYELEERVVETKFEDVQDEYLQKARQNALEKCEDCDKIIDEYYTLRHLSGITVVNYCIVTLEEIGEKYVG